MAASAPQTAGEVYAAGFHRSGSEAYLHRDKRGLLSAAILLLFRATERAGYHAR
jgi:hypothetical protein